MRFIWILVLLAGCAVVSDSSKVQTQLDGYATAAATGVGLEKFLAGAALDSAIQSAELMQSLGYRQVGLARFELAGAEAGSAHGCLDLSSVSVVDAGGALVTGPQRQRIGFSVDYDERFLITDLKVSDVC